ncbi:MAG: hypothetical protein ABJA87_14120 [bacterium]
MTSDHTSELFPIMEDDGQEFEVTMRGYDRRQVDSYIARADAELAALTAERDAALSRSADLAAQLANSSAEIESLRRRLADIAVEVTPENVHARVRPIVELAQAEARGIRESVDREATHLRLLADADAAETRRQAALDAERMRGQAQADLHRATEAAAHREHEAEEMLTKARAEIAERHDRVRRDAERLLGDARAEVEAMVSKADADRERLDATAAATRVRANEDFEIALRVRRSHEQKLDQDRHAAAVAEAERVTAEARATAEQTLDGAAARVTQLVELRRRVHADLDSVHGRLGQVLGHLAEMTQSHTVGPVSSTNGTGPLPQIDDPAPSPDSTGSRSMDEVQPPVAAGAAGAAGAAPAGRPA